MSNSRSWLLVGLLGTFALPAMAQSFRVQCPTSTITHPSALHDNNSEPAYTGPTPLVSTNPGAPANGYLVPSGNVNGAIKCQQISGGDGYATMGDGTQTYMFSFGPLSGIAEHRLRPARHGESRTSSTPSTTRRRARRCSRVIRRPPSPCRRSRLGGLTGAELAPLATFYNGAVGIAPDIANLVSIYDIAEDPVTNTATQHRVTVQTNSPLGVNVGDTVVIAGAGTGYNGSWKVTSIGLPTPLPSTVVNYGFPNNFNFTVNVTATGLADVNESPDRDRGHPAAGRRSRRSAPDHGCRRHERQHPGAADGDRRGRRVLPDADQRRHDHASGPVRTAHRPLPRLSERFRVLRRRAGCLGRDQHRRAASPTTTWRPTPAPTSGTATSRRPSTCRWAWSGRCTCARGRTACRSAARSISALRRSRTRICAPPAFPPTTSSAAIRCRPAAQPRMPPRGPPAGNYAYNDGDGSTYYDVEYPIQIHGFDPNFHFVGMTFNPEGFADMKDKYFLLNGRSYPDTVTPGPLADAVGGRREPLLAAAAGDHQHPGRVRRRCCASRTWTSPSTRRWPRSASR